MAKAPNSVIDALPDLLWTARTDGHVDFVNERWHDYTGLALAESSGWQWQAAIHPDNLLELQTCWRSGLQTGDPFAADTRLRRRDGAYRWFSVRAYPVKDAGGQVQRWCCMLIDINDRKRAEQELSARELRFRWIVDGLPAIITLMTREGELEDANHRMLEYFGASLEELKARPTTQSFHPEDRPAVDARWKASIETGQPYDFEARLRRADGVYRWFHTRGFPLRDPDDNIVLWYLLQTDIDDQKRAEALLAGERRLLEMVASGNSLPTVLDALCRLVEEVVSGCYCSVGLVDQTTSHLQLCVAPSLPSSFTQAAQGLAIDLASSPRSASIYLNAQANAPAPDQAASWTWHEWQTLALTHGLRAVATSQILSTHGKLLGVFAALCDEARTAWPQQSSLVGQFAHLASIVIERAQGDEALKRSEAFLAKAQRLSSSGSFSWRISTDEITWSEQVYRLFEIDPGTVVTLELIGSHHHPDDMVLVVDMVEKARAGKDFEYEHRLVMRDGSIKYLHTLAHATRDQDGQIEYIGAVQDVTQRRLSDEALSKARSELAHVSRVSSLGALTASIAHEVSQPLAGIVTNANTCLRMLAADSPNVVGALETARRTIRDANRASDVITRLRALFAKAPRATESVDLNEAAREVIALLRNELQRGRVSLRVDLAGNLPTVAGDRIQLQQVILNLLLNASDAMSVIEDHPRHLLVRTAREKGNRVRLSVRDCGIGIDAQTAERLFDAFFTTKSHGMGIGLSVSRSIIESHQGRLWADRNHGPGATFSFSIPCGSAHETQRPQPHGPSHESSAERFSLAMRNA